LVANQRYMDADKDARVADFTLQASTARERLESHVKEYGVGEDLEWEVISAGIEEERQKFAAELGEPSPGVYKAIRPFNKSARERIEEAGMQWHYDLFYATDADSRFACTGRSQKLTEAWGDRCRKEYGAPSAK
jgi:hypothetical protein